MSTETAGKPHVGIPYRTRKEELAGDRTRYDSYLEAVRQAGGEAVEVSLGLTTSELANLARQLDAVVLPGSPSDVDPARYGAQRHTKCADPDRDRERTDFALLEHALTEQKPVLAICYGIQSLNVFLGGSLIQDIPNELHTTIQHEWVGRSRGVPEPHHSALAQAGSRLLALAGSPELRVNSSHHQSVREVGRDLRVTALAPDGVVEAVEWIAGKSWVLGVQWHPERMVATDSLARALFEDLIAAAAKTPAKEGVAGRR